MRISTILIPELSELRNSMKWALDKEVMFETGILKIAMPKENINENVAVNTVNAPLTTGMPKVQNDNLNANFEIKL